jgi:flavin-binding protein dodecin
LERDSEEDEGSFRRGPAGLAWSTSRVVSYTEVELMTVAKVTEITATSTKSFEDATATGIERANKTLKNISGAWLADQEVVVENGKITLYKVRMRVTFVLV